MENLVWQKKGLIYSTLGNRDWNKSHAQLPIVDMVNDEFWRIYYATRDNEGRSNISFINVEAGNPSNILKTNEQTILKFGKPGTFDECGIMPLSIINFEDKKFLYYVGWSLKKTVPYQNSIGLAISLDGGMTFQKFSEGPIIGVNHIDPYYTGTCYVLKDTNILRAYYLSCVEWKTFNGKQESLYVIKYAESENGIDWKREGKIAIQIDGEEGGIASASVLKEGGIYKMWFSYRNSHDFRENVKNTYRIGYAVSDDGIEWKRKMDGPELDISVSGWDSEMVAYPNVIKYNDLKYMFYNGNGFGKSGFGFAVK